MHQRDGMHSQSIPKAMRTHIKADAKVRLMSDGGLEKAGVIEAAEVGDS